MKSQAHNASLRHTTIYDRFQGSGTRVCDVARRHDVARGLIYQWRRAALRQAEPVLVPTVVVNEPAGQASDPGVAAEFDLPDGARLRIFASASPGLALMVQQQLHGDPHGGEAAGERPVRLAFG